MIEKYYKTIKKEIKNHNTIFITGHRNLDLDALGSCIGFYTICKKFNKKAYIVIDDQKHELGVNKILKEFNQNIITSNEIESNKTNKNLLVVLDTNKVNLLQNENLLNQIEDVLIIDHHEENKNTIKKAIKVLDNNISSASEMITELIIKYKIKLLPQEATFILSGIVLDTNNFVLKTTQNTFKNAYLLTQYGADPLKVQYYLKQDIMDYILRQDLIRNIQIKNGIAITLGNEKIIYKREELAKMADTILQFDGIHTSYVLGKIENNLLGLSARSNNEIDVSKTCEKFGGGGDKNDAAAQIETDNLEDTFNKLKKFINGDE